METEIKIKINYKEYPECMFAIIAAFLPSWEGQDVRDLAGKVFFRSEDNKGRTYRNGLLHSYDDIPAVELLVNFPKKMWYKDGKFHRDRDLPAITSKSNTEWFENGKRHRERGLPALIYEGVKGIFPASYTEWWVDGKRHREGDLPAVETVTGHREWWINGKRHREGDLPAVVSINGHCEWWINGELVRCN
jgi:hypothetical protein